MKQLTIVLPVYNVAAYIERCLRSIYSQNVDENLFEVIIVDDETPDNSIEIAERFLEGHSNYQIIHQENRGLGGARNTGISNAKGKYIWFVDSDDELIKGALRIVIKSICNENSDIVKFSYLRNDDEYFYSSDTLPAPSLFEGVEMILSGNMITTAWNSIYKSSFLRDKGLFFKEKFKHEDSEFNLRACIYACKVTCYDIPIYRYYTNNSGSIMNNIRLQNQLDLIKYTDTADKIIINHDKNIAAAVSRYVLLSLAMLFKQSLLLSKEDYRKFVSIIKKSRKRYSKYFPYFTMKEKIIMRMQLIFVNRHLTSLIYYKKLKAN